MKLWLLVAAIALAGLLVSLLAWRAAGWWKGLRDAERETHRAIARALQRARRRRLPGAGE